MQLKQDMNLSFAIHTLGCKVNTYESDAMAQSLRAAGFSECAFTELADVYIINTCTVTNVADRKSRQMLRRARRLNPEALVVAAGCYVDDARKNDTLQELLETGVIDIAVSNKDKEQITRLVLEAFSSLHTIKDEGIGTGRQATASAKPASDETLSATADMVVKNKPRPAVLTELDGHTRAFIKVQDGCNMYCTYCIIPYVRGQLQARPVADVLEEVSRLAEQGVAETVLTGIHLTSLGEDLIRMLQGIQEIPGIRRIRLGSLEPTLITREFTGRLKEITKLCPHFHLSLQSGSNEILHRMNRHYTAAEYRQSCDILREFYTHPAITTDIIVGFPGETDRHFRETYEFAREIGFYEAHVFKYSRRRGTPADRMPDQIPESVKEERSRELIALSDRMSHDFRSYYLGRKTDFLSEELIPVGGRLYETGYNREYVRCLKAADTLHANCEIDGKGSQIIQENAMDESLLLI